MSAIAFKTLGGEGPDVVLIHGFGSDRLSWLGNSPALMTLARVHALDLPGHGESSPDVGDGSASALAERIADGLAAQGIGRAHLVGHSLGGGIAVLLAARNPALVRTLTLIAPAGLGKGVDQDFVRHFPLLDDLDAVLAQLRRLVVRPQLINKMTAQRVLAQIGRDGVRDAFRQIAAALAESETTILAAAQSLSQHLPRLVAWGEEDAINPIDAGRVSAFGGACHMIAETGHLPHIENPKAMNDLLSGFLAAHRDA